MTNLTIKTAINKDSKVAHYIDAETGVYYVKTLTWVAKITDKKIGLPICKYIQKHYSNLQQDASAKRVFEQVSQPTENLLTLFTLDEYTYFTAQKPNGDLMVFPNNDQNQRPAVINRDRLLISHDELPATVQYGDWKAPVTITAAAGALTQIIGTINVDTPDGYPIRKYKDRWHKDNAEGTMEELASPFVKSAMKWMQDETARKLQQNLEDILDCNGIIDFDKIDVNDIDAAKYYEHDRYRDGTTFWYPVTHYRDNEGKLQPITYGDGERIDNVHIKAYAERNSITQPYIINNPGERLMLVYQDKVHSKSHRKVRIYNAFYADDAQRATRMDIMHPSNSNRYITQGFWDYITQALGEQAAERGEKFYYKMAQSD